MLDYTCTPQQNYLDNRTCSYVQFVWFYHGSFFLHHSVLQALLVPPSLETRLQTLSLDRMASLYAKCFA